VRVEVVDPLELAPEDVQDWRRIQAKSGELDSPFLSPHFAIACARVRRRTRVAIFSACDGSTGYFPFEVGRAGRGRAIGQGLSDVQGLVAPMDAHIDMRALLSACRLRSWEFDGVLAWQRPWLSGSAHRSVTEISPVIDVGAGWAAYERTHRQISRSLLKAIARQRRKLEAEHGPLSLVFHEHDHALLEQVLTWKSEQYRRTGWRDLFADGGMRRLVHDLLDVTDHDFGAPLAVLRAGDEVIGAHLGLRSSSTLAWWFPVYAPSFARYSPGLMLCLDLVRAMHQEGLRVLDLGKGDEPYKQRLANSGIPLLRGVASPYRLIPPLDAARRWPKERAVGFVQGSPRLRRWARDVRAGVAYARTR
jgi:CelD/BcsL family acetyltransferase involved in cellulose biosynthesis